MSHKLVQYGQSPCPAPIPSVHVTTLENETLMVKSRESGRE